MPIVTENGRRGRKSAKTVPEYLRGPIAWSWLLNAMSLSGAALKVGLVLWHRRALNKSLTFTVGTSDIAKFLKLSEATVRRAIDSLACGGLILLDCAPGRKCKVTIADNSVTQPTPVAESGNNPVREYYENRKDRGRCETEKQPEVCRVADGLLGTQE